MKRDFQLDSIGKMVFKFMAIPLKFFSGKYPERNNNNKYGEPRN